MYDNSALNVNYTSGNVIPRPVLWILARFHPRYIWCGRAFRNVQKLTESLNGVANRIRRTWFLPEKEGSNLTHPVSPALGSWPWSSRLSVSREFAKCHRVDSRDRSFSHKIPFVDFGLRILASSNFEAVANDKDGGRYTFVDPEVLSMIHVHMLGNDQSSNLIGRAWTWDTCKQLPRTST